MGDLKSKNWQYAYAVSTHRAYTLLQITGSGILTSCCGNENYLYSLEIDGQVYSFGLPDTYGDLSMFHRFKTNVKITCDVAGGAGISYLLD